MSYPQNPNTIIIKNEYYPTGLKEIDIWNYYQKVRTNLLKETIGKNLIVFFFIDTNKYIVMRKTKDKKLIKLNPSNYDIIISGRTISFHNVMDRYSNYGIIDIDTDDFNKAKDLTIELYHIFNQKKYIKDVKIIYTGKDSFHIRVFYPNEYKIEYIKQEILNDLNDIDSKNKFTIKAKRTKGTPNLDLQRNIYNAGYIALNSLSVDGLKCTEVPIRKIKMFRKEDVKII